MPEQPLKIRSHPRASSNGASPAVRRRTRCAAPYAELHVTSNFTFLTGASHPDELVHRAAELGHSAAAIADVNSLAGIVRAHVAAKEIGIPLAVGCRLSFQSDDHPRQAGGSVPDVLVYPADRAAYGRLCRLLTIGKRRAPKGACSLTLHDLLEHQDGLLAVVIPPEILDHHFIEVLQGLRRRFDDDRLSLAVSRLRGPDDEARIRQLLSLSDHVGVPLAATNDVHYHVPQRRALQDVLTCIRHGCTIEQAGRRLLPNAERHLKSPEEMARLFADVPHAPARSAEIARRASSGFNLDELRYEYPHEVVPPGSTPMQHLIHLTRAGAAGRYPRGVPTEIRSRIEHEFRLIEELNYAPYFLTVHDLVTFARSRGILCQGRGAAANSAVCYCLGVTAVDPGRIDLLFERFISRERNEPPDIDIDFEHERREEVIQYIYNKYGRDRAALTAEVITYRGRSAIRDVGKAMGLSLDCVDRLARSIDWWKSGPVSCGELRALGFNPDEPAMKATAELAHEVLGFPRHLSQHVGGFVITQTPLCEMVPVENAAMEDRTVIEWDKDDIDAMGMLKVDVLGLGMLTAIGRCFDMLNADGNASSAKLAACGFALHTVPPEDPAVYDMICRADTVGVFQIESRAQMSMLPRLRPRCFYDLVIEVAIVRPGPIQGDMVHPYLRRRSGEEPASYPDERIRKVLGRTLGVPLFQEQAMSLAVAAAGFTPDEADQLRRAIAAWKQKGHVIEDFRRRIVDGMTANGYERKFAEQCFNQIKGFSGYGFPESHAASFALLVYVSAWLKCHCPAHFAAALLNSQPMGFYAPAQIVRDARDHGVEVRPVDINNSAWDCTLEPRHEVKGAIVSERRCESHPALRLGMRLVKGLAEREAARLRAAVERSGPFMSIPSLHRAGGVRIGALRRLAAADAFGSMGLERQQALWEVRALGDEALPMFDDRPSPLRPSAPSSLPDRLPRVPLLRHVARDYATVGLTLRSHPMSFLRGRLNERGVMSAAHINDQRAVPHGTWAAVAGLVLVRQRPATASGIVFMTLEDESGVANLIIRPPVYEKHRAAARHGRVILARGRVERQGEVVHLVAEHLEVVAALSATVPAMSRDFH